MDTEVFRRHGHELIDWVADYLDRVEDYPVLSRVAPGDIRDSLPQRPPERGEPMERILADFRDLIMPGVTHWNHPRFFAYFPANNSGPSILGELLSAGLGVNAMLWETCPAATELEALVMDWLRQMLGLPNDFRGVIQDTASTGTLCALVCARERLTNFGINARGFAEGARGGPLRVYASKEAHSSVEKGAKIAGFGATNVVAIHVDDAYAMDPRDLESRITADKASGFRPCCIVATVGTTSSTAIDPLVPIAAIAERHSLWLHVDAALAGSAAILPEKRWLLDGAQTADSLIFNPHKWLFTNFDCSAYLTRDANTLTAALSVLPAYLATERDAEVTNFRDWSIQLGRRFRALKLWFVLRSFGVDGLRERLREHIRLADEFRRWVEKDEDFEVLAPVPLNTVCFRFRPLDASGTEGREEALEAANKQLLHEVNASGRIYITDTRLDGRYALRFCVGQARTRRRHVAEAWQCIRDSGVVRSQGLNRRGQTR